MSLRERLEGKQARTVVVQVPVESPPPGLRERVSGLVEQAAMGGIALTMEGSTLTEEQVDALAEQAQAAVDELAEFYEPVELRAVSAAAWDALHTKHADENGEWESYDHLPELLALCCTDPELRDVEWWRQQIDGDGWAVGELRELHAAVIRLNSYAPLPSLGKGSRATR